MSGDEDDRRVMEGMLAILTRSDAQIEVVAFPYSTPEGDRYVVVERIAVGLTDVETIAFLQGYAHGDCVRVAWREPGETDAN